MAEVILEYGKLVMDGITADRIPFNVNLRRVKRVKIATCTVYKIVIGR